MGQACSASGRYIRVRLPGASRTIGLTTIEVYANEQPAAPPTVLSELATLALPSIAAATLSDGSPASVCIDGVTEIGAASDAAQQV